MRWQDLVNMTPEQFNRMSKSELKAATQILASVGNKRLKRAQTAGFSSPSIEAVLTKGKFSTKDKSFNQLRNEFMRAKQFLQSKTGTLSEMAKFKRESIEKLKAASGISITGDQFDRFWRAYEELKKKNPELAERGLKYEILKEIENKITEDPEIDVDKIVNSIDTEINFIYEISQEQTMQAEESATDLGDWLDALPEVDISKIRMTDEERAKNAYRQFQKRSRRKKK